MKEYVRLKGKKDRLVIQLDSLIDFDTLKSVFTEKIKQAESFIGNNEVAIEFSNRNLSEVEETILIDIINKNTSIRVAFVFSEDSAFSQLPINNIKEVTDEGSTKFYKGTLRSGHLLEFDGNVVVLGDVNPGATIKAKGNVIVLGYINGTVYVGDNEGTDAFVGAFSLNPIQIKIGNIIAKNPNSNILDANKIKKTCEFEIAYLKDGNIFIEKFNKNTLNHMINI